MSEKVDICIEYIKAKDASYLAKEGIIVYFASPTGREQDKDWQKFTLAETRRIITSTRLDEVKLGTLLDGDIVQAFQELDRVYEFGMTSQYGTAEGIFNYSEQGGINILAAVCMSATDVLMAHNMTAVTSGLVLVIVRDVMIKLGRSCEMTETKACVLKYFTGVGYVYRSGSKRPLIKGLKQNTLMMSGTKPRDVVDYETCRHNINNIVEEIHRRVK
jgi:hypothetical protein